MKVILDNSPPLINFVSCIFVLRSSCLLLLDHVTFDILLKVDNVTSVDTSSDSKVRNFLGSQHPYLSYPRFVFLFFIVLRLARCQCDGYL